MQGKTIHEALLVTSQDGHSQLQMHAVSVEFMAANSSGSYCSLGKALVHQSHMSSEEKRSPLVSLPTVSFLHSNEIQPKICFLREKTASHNESSQ